MPTGNQGDNLFIVHTHVAKGRTDGRSGGVGSPLAFGPSGLT
jgi:hypothetical protein